MDPTDNNSQNVSQKRVKSKQELAEIRKQMMRKKFNPNSNTVGGDSHSEMSKLEFNMNNLYLRNNQNEEITPKSNANNLQINTGRQTPMKRFEATSNLKKNREHSAVSQSKLPNENLLARLASG